VCIVVVCIYSLSVYIHIAVACCLVPLSRDEMTSAISADHLGTVWTPERTLDYLLLTGLLSEAVLFVGQLCDWKAQIILSASIHHHRGNTANVAARSVVSSSLFFGQLRSGICMSVRPSIRPQAVFCGLSNSNEIWCVGRG